MLANKSLERTDGINFMIIVVCLWSEIELDVCFGWDFVLWQCWSNYNMRVCSFVDQLVVRGPHVSCSLYVIRSLPTKGRVRSPSESCWGFPRTTYGVVRILLVKYVPLLLLRDQHAISSMSYDCFCVRCFILHQTAIPKVAVSIPQWQDKMMMLLILKVKRQDNNSNEISENICKYILTHSS